MTAGDVLAPAIAQPEPLPADLAARTTTQRDALRAVLRRLDDTGLPFRRVELGDGPDGAPLLRFGQVDCGAFLLWARTLNVQTIAVDAGAQWSTTLRLTARVGDGHWSVTANVRRPDHGDRLGGAAVEYGVDGRGRRSSTGRVSVDELAAGLARMGIAEYTAATEDQS